jgi:putative transposase
MSLRHPYIKLLDLTAGTLVTALMDPDVLNQPAFPDEHPSIRRKRSVVPPEAYTPVPEHRSPYKKRITTPHRDSHYLLTTRFCSNSPFFGADEMRVFRAQLEKTAQFCGVTLLNYTLLDDHFHLLVRIPKLTDREAIPRAEVLSRAATYYEDESFAELLQQALDDEESGFTPAIEWFPSRWLRAGVRLVSLTETAQAWATREVARLRGMMHEVAMFMKLLKQRFSLWYNATHERFGTLWVDRYRSLLVENTPASLRAAAAYIDMNAVRRGLVENPEDYPFCGLAEAFGGPGWARDAVMAIWGELPVEGESAAAWPAIVEQHRALLWGPSRKPEIGEPRLADFFSYCHDLFLRGVGVGSQKYIRQLFSDNREAFGTLSSKMAAYFLQHPHALTAGSWGFEGMWVLRARRIGFEGLREP